MAIFAYFDTSCSLHFYGGVAFTLDEKGMPSKPSEKIR